MANIDKVLLLKYLDGTLTEAEASCVYEWSQENDDNREYLLSMREASMTSKYSKARSSSDTKREWKKLEKRAGLKEKKPSRILTILNLAASLIILASVGTIFLSRDKEFAESLSTMSVETGIGQSANATMPDGTLVKLNSCSKLSYNPTRWKTERRVDLSGEASFDVVHNDRLPFYVSTTRYKVMVLGTTFNVKSYPGAEEDYVALKSGKVRIGIFNASSNTLDITPGNCFVFDNTSGRYDVKPTDSHLFSWEDGEIVFDNQTIVQKKAELYRLYGYTFRISKGCSTMSYRASFKKEGLNEMMAVFAHITPNMSYKIDDKNKIVSIQEIIKEQP